MTNKINEIVERQIATWHAQRRTTSQPPKTERNQPAPNVITLSNERGAGGLEVARQLGAALGMPIYDREIVEHIATNKHVRVSTVETLDQLALGRIEDYLLNLFRDWSFDQRDYAQALVHTLLLLWHHGPAVIVGRGAVHVIPREHALAVRVIANDKQRSKRVAALEETSEDASAEHVAEVDGDRDAFSRHYFGVSIDDAKTYDLVLNTSFLSTNAAAALAADAYRLKFPESTEPAKRALSSSYRRQAR